MYLRIHHGNHARLLLARSRESQHAPSTVCFHFFVSQTFTFKQPLCKVPNHIRFVLRCSSHSSRPDRCSVLSQFALQKLNSPSLLTTRSSGSAFNPLLFTIRPSHPFFHNLLSRFTLHTIRCSQSALSISLLTQPCLNSYTTCHFIACTSIDPLRTSTSSPCSSAHSTNQFTPQA